MQRKQQQFLLVIEHFTVLMCRSAVCYGLGRGEPSSGGQPWGCGGHCYTSGWRHRVFSRTDERRISCAFHSDFLCQGGHRAAPPLEQQVDITDFMDITTEHSGIFQNKMQKTEFNCDFFSYFFSCVVWRYAQWQILIMSDSISTKFKGFTNMQLKALIATTVAKSF